jgi:putative endonuclease
MRPCYVYILSNRRYGVLYVGFTNNLPRRVFEHKTRAKPGFASDYGATRLVYVEEYPTALEARAREQSLKRWRRDWKLKLVDDFNPTWRDLAKELTG